MENTNELNSADIVRIMKLIPHRYPFLMVDRIIEMDSDNSCVGIKNVSINEPHFSGHFPNQPVMPGVLIIEAMAQTAGTLCVSSLKLTTNPPIVYMMSIDKAKFRKPVLPGDVLKIPVRKVKNRGLIWKFKAEAHVESELVAESEITAMISNEPADNIP